METESVKKAQILDAAAELFAEVEFHGTSMRMIADRAGVSQSLIHYHYDTKEQLHEAVFERHFTMVNDRRASLLRKFLVEGPTVPREAIEELVSIIILPWIDIIQDKHRPTREFAKFMIRSAYHDDDWNLRLAKEHYAGLLSLGTAAFKKILPKFNDDDAFRAYTFTLSMFFMALSAPGRMKVLAGRDDLDMIDPAVLLEQGTRFAVAGINALHEEAIAREGQGRVVSKV